MADHFASKTRRVAAGGSLLVGGVAGGLVLAPSAGATPTTFHVSNLLDTGAGSLRQAIDDANNNAGADIIVFDAGAAGTITLTTGQIAIFDDVTITGLGAADSIISGNNNSSIFYVYGDLFSAVQTVSISGLTLTDGSAVNSGGAIFSRHSDLTLSGVIITGNTASNRGGGLYSGDGVAYGRAPVTIIDSEISNNTSGNDGGGINVYQAGDVTITNTVVSGNTSNRGGGARLYSVEDISIVNSSFENNEALGGSGGGMYFRYAGYVSIDSTTFDQNTADGRGGGAYVSFNDGFTMTNSTVSGNGGTEGVGIQLRDVGDALIANTTIANNVSSDAQYGNSGALNLRSASGSTEILFSTISGNSSKDNIVRLGASAGFAVEITGTIFSDNTTDSGSGTQAEELYMTAGTTRTVTSSLIMGTTSGTPFTDGGGNINGVSAQLGALADNGGPTFTMEPATGSPVIDAGPLTWTAFNGDGFDQRGTPYVRVYNGQSDMGALEVKPDPVSPTTTTTTVLPTTTTTVATEPVTPQFTG